MAQQRRRKARKARQRREDRIRAAADACAEVVADGWREAVVEKIVGCVDDDTWNQLLGTAGRRYCRSLAKLAATILETKEAVHGLLGRLAGLIAQALRADRVTTIFVEQLTARIPIPPMDTKMVAVARVVQLTGIVLCLETDTDLTNCPCFRALALSEAKRRVVAILVAGVGDWTKLTHFGSRTSGS